LAPKSPSPSSLTKGVAIRRAKKNIAGGKKTIGPKEEMHHTREEGGELFFSKAPVTGNMEISYKPMQRPKFWMRGNFPH